MPFFQKTPIDNIFFLFRSVRKVQGRHKKTKSKQVLQKGLRWVSLHNLINLHHQLTMELASTPLLPRSFHTLGCNKTKPPVEIASPEFYDHYNLVPTDEGALPGSICSLTCRQAVDSLSVRIPTKMIFDAAKFLMASGINQHLGELLRLARARNLFIGRHDFEFQFASNECVLN